jgi:hypothetical protein
MVNISSFFSFNVYEKDEYCNLQNNYETAVVIRNYSRYKWIKESEINEYFILIFLYIYIFIKILIILSVFIVRVSAPGVSPSHKLMRKYSGSMKWLFILPLIKLI